MKAVLFLGLLGLLLLAGCVNQTNPPNQNQIANPASVYCEQQGGSLRIESDANGGQIGYCTLADGTVCEEWAYYRGECETAGPTVGMIAVTVKDTPPSELENGFFLTISEVQVHPYGSEDQNESGWIALGSSAKTFDLLNLQTVHDLFAELEIPAGQYTKIRLKVDKAEQVIDRNRVSFKVPSGKLQINQSWGVDANKLTVITLDFDINRSFVTAGSQRLFKPVIKVIVQRDAELEPIPPLSQRYFRIKNGTTESELEHEFDSEGKKVCGDCPYFEQYLPPEFCEEGKWVAGVLDECGCQGPPTCQPNA